MIDKRRIGIDGENHACDFLISQGYRILERNFRIRTAEIDIIAALHSVLCFIEVKKRKNTVFGEPSESVKVHKQKKIIQAAQAYLLLHENIYTDFEIRFDIIGISDKGIEHFEGAFDDSRQ